MNTQEKEEQRLHQQLSTKPKLTFHFDGKKYDEGGNWVERVPMLLSGFEDGGDHLLEVPMVADGKAKTLSSTVSCF